MISLWWSVSSVPCASAPCVPWMRHVRMHQGVFQSAPLPAEPAHLNQQLVGDIANEVFKRLFKLFRAVVASSGVSVGVLSLQSVVVV
uniref:Putative secreted protein n=1 Tax=Ixodes ricinus TaxID=34613 RepID=A0A6B0U9K6_IXORI